MPFLLDELGLIAVIAAFAMLAEVESLDLILLVDAQVNHQADHRK